MMMFSHQGYLWRKIATSSFHLTMMMMMVMLWHVASFFMKFPCGEVWYLFGASWANLLLCRSYQGAWDAINAIISAIIVTVNDGCYVACALPWDGRVSVIQTFCRSKRRAQNEHLQCIARGALYKYTQTHKISTYNRCTVEVHRTIWYIYIPHVTFYNVSSTPQISVQSRGEIEEVDGGRQKWDHPFNWTIDEIDTLRYIPLAWHNNGDWTLSKYILYILKSPKNKFSTIGKEEHIIYCLFCTASKPTVQWFNRSMWFKKLIT